ncbi:MAG: hypothetical protein LKF71_04860 [Oscillospiraceae bacterium]|jgi:hypothetical protein|nr:hypothetical protein [Oscillospiraceae bacterium]
MHILGYELKKIFNWKLLLFMVAFTGLFCNMFLNFDLDYQGHPPIEDYEIGKIMVNKYGPTLDQAELQDFIHTDYQKARQEINSRIAKSKAFQDAKVSTLKQYEVLDNQASTTDEQWKQKQKLFDALYAVDNNSSKMDKPLPIYMYQEMRNRTEDFKISSADWLKANLPRFAPDEQKFAKQTAAWEDAHGASTLPDFPILNSWSDEIQKYLPSLLILNLMILISPVLIREHRSGVRDIAYTCKKGRPLLRTQFAAAMIAAILTELVLLGGFLLVYCFGAHHDDLLFLDCRISSIHGLIYGCNLKFWQFILVNCVLMFLCAFSFALLSFALSRVLKNYVAILAVQIPVAFLGSKFLNWIMENALTEFIAQPQWIVLCVAILLLPLLFCVLLIHREQRINLLD